LGVDRSHPYYRELKLNHRIGPEKSVNLNQSDLTSQVTCSNYGGRKQKDVRKNLISKIFHDKFQSRIMADPETQNFHNFISNSSIVGVKSAYKVVLQKDYNLFLFTTNDLVKQYMDSKIINSSFLTIKRKEIHDSEQKLMEVFHKMFELKILSKDTDFRAIITGKNVVQR
jgi:hypothetical protein